ncbi:MAG: thiol:disulfide interchange protein DsbA/DsbL [Burkholderiaceae bacterium]
MSKREFLMSSAALAAASALPMSTASAAQAGKDYRLIKPPQRTEVAAGKIEVVEFFWFACPHCYSLEPIVDEWAAKLPDDVEFRRIHVQFRQPKHQQIFYTLQALGEDKRLALKVFEAIHKERKRMNKVGEIKDWAVANGLDGDKFMSTFDSFGIRTQMSRATKAVETFGVDSVPMLAVNGKYLTSPSMVGSNAGVLKVVEDLIQMERKAA